LTDDNQGAISPNRQAGAAFSAAISGKPELAAERLRIVQDAIDRAHHFVDDTNDWLARNNLNALDRYRNGEVCLMIKLNGLSGRCPIECDLVFFAVPSKSVTRGRLRISASDSSASPRHELARESDRNKSNMFAGITKLVQSPQGIIPSLVRLERSKKRADFRGQILAAAGQVVPPSFFGRAEGEFSALKPGISASSGGGVSSLIEHGTQIVGGVEKDIGEVVWQPSSKLDFVKVVDAIDIFLDNMGPRLWVDKLIDFGVKIVDVMLCT